MMQRFYQVAPRDGAWVVWETGGVMVGTYATKEDAVEAGCAHATSGRGTVIVRGPDGSVEREIDCREPRDRP